MKTNVLVCFNNNDCVVTWINCNLQGAKQYYIGKSFDGKVGMVVIDTDKPFKMKVLGLHDNFREFQFVKINYDYQVDFRIEIKEVLTGETLQVEPQWFYAHSKRVIEQ